MTVLGDRQSFKQVIGLNEVMRVGPSPDHIYVLMREEGKTCDAQTQRKDHRKTQGEDSNLQAKERRTEETNLLNNLISTRIVKKLISIVKASIC